MVFYNDFVLCGNEHLWIITVNTSHSHLCCVTTQVPYCREFHSCFVGALSHAATSLVYCSCATTLYLVTTFPLVLRPPHSTFHTFPLRLYRIRRHVLSPLTHHLPPLKVFSSQFSSLKVLLFSLHLTSLLESWNKCVQT